MHDWCHGPLAQVGQAGLHAIVADLTDCLNQSTGTFKPATPLTYKDGEHDQAHQLRERRLHVKEGRLRQQVPKSVENANLPTSAPVRHSCETSATAHSRMQPLIEVSNQSLPVRNTGAAATIMARRGTRIQPSPGRNFLPTRTQGQGMKISQGFVGLMRQIQRGLSV